MNIVGVAGLPRSGKDTLAELFMERGYFGVSLGDIVREASRERHSEEPDPISFKNMTETANHLRTTHGPDFALKEAVRRFEQASKKQNYKGLVVFSVRAPIEAEFIVHHGGDLIWVEASDEVRLQRAIQSRREGEPQHTLQDMKAQEALQQQPQPGLPHEVQMDITYVKAHATKIIENNGSDVEFFKQNAAKILHLL